MALTARRLSPGAHSLRTASVLLACQIVVACSNSRPPPVSLPVAVPAAPDASYDWRVLMSIPFKTRLKDSPVPLHEVLLFHDQPSTAEVEHKECYALDGTPPRFLGRPPEDHLLCFDHDRLNRIEASVQLPAEEAPAVLARACVVWSKNSAPPGNLCEGQDGAVAYSARLSLASGDATGTLAITLLDVVPPT